MGQRWGFSTFFRPISISCPYFVAPLLPVVFHIDMAAYMRNTKARSAKAVFERRVALVQLAAWVNVRKAQPDVCNVYGRERETCVMDLLEQSRDGRCLRARWLSCLQSKSKTRHGNNTGGRRDKEKRKRREDKKEAEQTVPNFLKKNNIYTLARC
jgi:hypothetical protein